MNPDELTAWRKKHELTLEGFGSLLGVTKACVSRWESGKRKIPPFLHIALKCLKVKKGGRTIRGRKSKKEKEVKK